MARAVSPDERIEYILEEDRESQQPTVFLLRHPTHREYKEWLRKLAQSGSRFDASVPDEEQIVMGMDFVELAHEIAGVLLVGWRDFRFANGSEVPFRLDRQGRATTETLALLEPMTLVEIGRHVLTTQLVSSRDTEDDLGKSPPAT